LQQANGILGTLETDLGDGSQTAQSIIYQVRSLIFLAKNRWFVYLSMGFFSIEVKIINITNEIN